MIDLPAVEILEQRAKGLCKMFLTAVEILKERERDKSQLVMLTNNFNLRLKVLK